MDSTTSILDAPATPTLLFRAGGIMYGCDIVDAQEIMPIRPMTRLPGAPPFVRGLINMRGTIVTVLDLGVRLDSTQAPVGESDGSIVLLRYRERLVGIVVDEVADVRAVAIDETDTPSRGAVVRGVATVDDVAVFILDLDALVSQVLLS